MVLTTDFPLLRFTLHTLPLMIRWNVVRHLRFLVLFLQLTNTQFLILLSIAITRAPTMLNNGDFLLRSFT